MKIKSGFVLERVGNQYLAVAVGEAAESFSGLVRMNETGSFLWNLIKDADMSRDELVEALAKEYDAPKDVLCRDVDIFIEKLTAGGIFE